MYKYKVLGFFLLGLALALSVLQVQGNAAATHPVRLMTFVYQRVATVDPGTMWIDRTGMHIRNRMDIGLLTGDIEGDATVVYNADLLPYFLKAQTLPVYGRGTAFGSIKIYSSDLEQALPIWSGNWTYSISNDQVVQGQLTAFSQGGGLILQVDEVSGSQDGRIVHTGTIDHFYCPDTGCALPED